MFAANGALAVGHGQRRPELRRIVWIGRDRELKLRSHNANHAISRAIQSDVLSNDVRISRKAVAPEALAENDNPVVPRLIFIGRKDSSQ
jgi:hypothetical protein